VHWVNGTIGRRADTSRQLRMQETRTSAHALFLLGSQEEGEGSEAISKSKHNFVFLYETASHVESSDVNVFGCARVDWLS